MNEPRAMPMSFFDKYPELLGYSNGSRGHALHLYARSSKISFGFDNPTVRSGAATRRILHDNSFRKPDKLLCARC